ncbi:MAG: glycosyltransferase [Nanoarchaeota archaeon]
MISIIVCHRNPVLLEALKKSVGSTIGVPHEFVVINNLDNQYNIGQAYNKGVVGTKYNHLVFVHEDVEFLTKDWGSALMDILKQNRVGAVGMAGSNYLNERGVWAEVGVPFVKGRVVHQDGKRLFVSTYSEEKRDEKVVALDGCFLACRKEVAQEIPFDETLDGFHFYDVDWSLRIAQKYDVLVTQSFMILHKSYGKKDEDPTYERLRKKFLEKHSKILPFTNQALKPDYKNIHFYKELELRRKDN